MNAQRIPVLMYHRIGQAHNSWEAKYCVSPGNFVAQMQRLAREGRRAVSLTDFRAWLDGESELPQGAFLLTFDDGFLGLHEHAMPVLESLDFRATVFLVSALIGKRDEWCRANNPSGATYPLLDRHHILEMSAHGFDFQSHTRRHADLPTLDDTQLADELSGSKAELEDMLDKPVDYLAYPFGHYDERVMAASKEAGYQAAFSVQPGFNRRDIDRFRIRRIDVFGTDTPAMLKRKIHFGSNDGSWRQGLRYYAGRIGSRLGLRDV